MSLREEWSAAEQQAILDGFDLRSIHRDRRRSGTAPWRTSLAPDGGSYFDPQATWTETHYTIQRNVLCEACGQLIG